MARQTDTFTYKGLTVEVVSDAIWFTVYNEAGKVCGTIERPHMGNKKWNAYKTDGSLVKAAIGPRTALMALANSI